MQTLIKPALHRRASLIYAYEWGADWVHGGVLVTIEGGEKCFRDVWDCKAQNGLIDWCSPVGSVKIDPPICVPLPPKRDPMA